MGQAQIQQARRVVNSQWLALAQHAGSMAAASIESVLGLQVESEAFFAMLEEQRSYKLSRYNASIRSYETGEAIGRNTNQSYCELG